MDIRAVKMVLLLAAIFIIPGQSRVEFQFECNGTDAELTSYSYLREPSLQEGYSRGTKTGSFNYLKGESIILSENFTYVHGNGTNRSYSDITHTLDVNFYGGQDGKGISEFYGKTFFQNNRATSAWKKIRYDNLTKWPSLGKSRNASFIVVDALFDKQAIPDAEDGAMETYNFIYQANVTDGVIETKDATGWSNRTGSRRIDWEHDTLMSGDQLNITNVLKDEQRFTTAAGPDEDWLSCCIGGTEPPYSPPIKDMEDVEVLWPNEGTFNTLKPAKLLPNIDRNQNCTINQTTGDINCANVTYDNFSCSDASCPGFECIFQFEDAEDNDDEKDGSADESKRSGGLRITNHQHKEEEIGTKTKVTYKIWVESVGADFDNVVLKDILPPLPEGNNWTYEGSVYTDETTSTTPLGDPVGLVVGDPVENNMLPLGWDLGTIPKGTFEFKGVLLTFSHPQGVNVTYTNNTVWAEVLDKGNVTVASDRDTEAKPWKDEV